MTGPTWIKKMKPKKKYSVNKNGDSFKVYNYGEYIGSISLKELGEYVLQKNKKIPIKENTQIPNVNDEEYEHFLRENK